MPINIQNIINQLEAKLTAADSNTSSNESLRLINLIEQINGSGGILEYQFPNQLPPVDSAQIGKLAYVRETDFYYDSSGLLGHFPKYYFAANDSDGWSEFDMNAKLNADSDYQAYLIPPPPPPPPPTQAQGTVSGYTSGGWFPNINEIEKFPFAADANATDVGDLTASKYGMAGTSSSVSGYTSGGSGDIDVIEKFPFAVDANGTDVGDLTVARNYPSGQSSSTSGYNASGYAPQLGPTAQFNTTIDKFSFSADGNATDVGDLTEGKYGAAGQSSTESGYVSGSSAKSNVIEKFPFATDANATDVGDLTVARSWASGQNSAESGYVSGGTDPANAKSNVIEKFPFATDANATDVGDLTQGRDVLVGQSSDVSGYSSGGRTPPFLNTIDKFPFAADANATDVGDLTQAKSNMAGQQV